MRKIKKILFILLLVIFTGCILKGVEATTITCSPTSVKVGTSVKITVSVPNVNTVDLTATVSGAGVNQTIRIVDGSMTGEAKTFSKSITVKPTSVGTITVSVSSSSNAVLDGKYVNVAATKSIKVTEATSSSNTTTTTTKSSNCNLSKLSLSVEGLNFKSSQTTYSIKVGADIDNITVKATTAHSKATYSVSGNKNLKTGNNVISIVVKAENGAKKTYKINVEKEGDIEQTSSALTNLIIEDVTFTEMFEKTVTEYTANPIKYTEKLNILPYTEAEEATYEIIGADKLVVGENKITVKVKSLDESTTTEYTVTFEMLEKEEQDAMQTIGPNVDENDKTNIEKDITVWEKLKANGLLITVYILALVEFVQVIYLYIKLEKTKKELEEKKTRAGARENN